MKLYRDLQSHARRSGAPVSYALIAGLVAMFLVAWGTSDRAIHPLVFLPAEWPARPWSVVTYPFASSGADLIGVLLSALWLYWIGTQVERELSSPRYSAFMAAMTLLPALMFWLGAALMNRPFPLHGMYLPLAGLTVAWATRNPTATLLLMFVIPVQARIVGWLTVALVFFGYGFGAPLMGAFACVHLALAWAFAAGRIRALPYGRAAADRQREMKRERERDERYFEEVRKREKEREERERLRKLFEGSIKDEE